MRRTSSTRSQPEGTGMAREERREAAAAAAAAAAESEVVAIGR